MNKLLIYDDQHYSGSLRNVDQSSAGMETLQLRFQSNEIKELMVSVFKSSYKYIVERKPKDPGNKKQVNIPNELAEYIELIPYR